jgi:NAD(P)-dependent dehydrogenase (short-subunit alcohol dehydrogenase family)
VSAALVTGGSAGIGLAVVRQLLDKGYEVLSLDVRPPGMTHPRLKHVAVDLTNPVSTGKVAKGLKKRKITTVIHNAGAIRPALLAEVKLEDFDALVKLHLSAAIVLVQASLPAMKAAGYGRVVLVSSRAVLGLPTRTSYSATKAGMLGMARTWALELAPLGITVNVVAPGPVRTANFHGIIPEGSPQVDKVIQSIPVKRLGEPEDVARAVTFFAARESGFITGQVLYVCGGTSVGTLVL